MSLQVVVKAVVAEVVEHPLVAVVVPSPMLPKEKTLNNQVPSLQAALLVLHPKQLMVIGMERFSFLLHPTLQSLLRKVNLNRFGK